MGLKGGKQMITKAELEDLKNFYSDDYSIQMETPDVISSDVLFLIEVIEKLMEVVNEH